MMTATTATNSKPIIDIATNTLNDVIPLLFQNPIISAYLDRCKPINEKAISNECYRIEYDDYEKIKRISVYLNGNRNSMLLKRKRG